MNIETKSAKLYERALQVMPGGCSRNAVLRKPHPAYAVQAKGCYVTDIEGVTRIDFANNMAAHVHGHSHPEIVDAVCAQVQKGTGFNFATEIEIDYAEHLIGRSEAFEKIRFVNSGTEAVMCALKAARAFTGRAKIAKVEGAYHGLYDFAEVSQTASPRNWGAEDQPASVPVSYGTSRSVLDDVVVIPFNDIEKALAILDTQKDELACILIDLMPHRIALHPAHKDFVHALFKWTRAHDILFVCDEVITFRSQYGGAQNWYNISADMTALGKMIGGGFPVGALAGRNDVMDVFNPLAPHILFPHSGTFSANPVTMVAGLTAMKMFDEQQVSRLNDLGEYARRRLREVVKLVDVPASIAGEGSMFRLHMQADIPANYRQAYASPDEKKRLNTVLNHMFDAGVVLINSGAGAVSTVMSATEIDIMAEAILGAFRKL